MSLQAAGKAHPRRLQTPALLRQGFRPFFLGAGVWALAAMVLWIAIVEGTIALPTVFDPVTWHAHEMLFGFAGAAVAGFLLTAVPNWTGRMPLQGAPLAVLAALWLAGRVAVATSELTGPLAAAALDLAFVAALLAAILREILAGRNWRNLPVCVALTCLLAANALIHLEVLTGVASGPAGIRLGISVLIALITLVGGRIVPSFTTNWLKKRGEASLPSPFGPTDRVTLLLTVATLLAWTAAPDAPLTAAALLVAGVSNALRLARWRGHRTLAEPLLWILHAGYAWVAIGLALMGAAILLPSAVPAASGVHALTTGAVGTMTLAMMTRATLGHTGHALHAGGGTVMIYACVTMAALLRVAAPISAADTFLLAAGVFWSAAFLLFAALFGPLLVGWRTHQGSSKPASSTMPS